MKMVLKPVKMEKVYIISLTDYKEAIIDYLHEKGVMQIENVEKEITKYLKIIPQSEVKEISEQYIRFKGLEKYLFPRKVINKYKFADNNDLFSKIEEIKIDPEINEIRNKLEEIKARKKLLENDMESLEILRVLGINANYLNSKNIFFIIGKMEIEDKNNLIKELSKYDFIYKIAGDHYLNFFVSGPKNFEEKAIELLNKFHASIFQLKRYDGTTEELLNKIKDELKSLEEMENKLKNQLEKISDEYYGLVCAISEELEIIMRKNEVKNKLASSQNVFAISGWIPEREFEKISNDLIKLTNNRVIFEKIKTEEDPPTLLENPKRIKFFEFFIKFYSLPNSLEFDPTLIFSIIFPIFFGFMLGDVGYAIIILLFSIWLLKRVTKPPKKSLLPKIIRNFAKTMMSNYSWAMLARAMIFGSFWGIVFGAIFNEYFGIQLPYKALLDPIEGVSKLLLITAWIGVIYVTYGLILGVINKYSLYKYYGKRDKKYFKEMVGRIGWVFITWGFTIFGLWILKWYPIYSLGNILGIYTGIPLIGIGTFLILFGEGIFSVMEMASIISHVLSFTRIMGVLLAAVILASVLDQIFIRAYHYGVLSHIIVAFLVLIIGHAVNILIAIFEPGIQGARLHYVEFFSKFFHGNGKPFTPFASRRRFTEK
ncbi:MAG: V-type ATP synthase subunit I [Thermoplasmata archaeon]